MRAALSQMDVPTRSSYVMAVVTAAERPAAASVTAVPRSLASAASPALAGALFAAGYAAWPLLLCGGLKILYDLLLLGGLPARQAARGENARRSGAGAARPYYFFLPEVVAGDGLGSTMPLFFL